MNNRAELERVARARRKRWFDLSRPCELVHYRDGWYIEMRPEQAGWLL